MTPTKSTTPKAKTTHRVTHATAAVAAKPAIESNRFFQGVGGRKTATAQVRVMPGKAGIMINGKELKAYFTMAKHQNVVTAALEAADMKNALGVTVRVAGGGIAAQADAVRHGIARALVRYNEDFKKKLRAHGFLTRDARHVERKKYGLKKARRAPQWAKR